MNDRPVISANVDAKIEVVAAGAVCARTNSRLGIYCTVGKFDRHNSQWVRSFLRKILIVLKNHLLLERCQLIKKQYSQVIIYCTVPSYSRMRSSPYSPVIRHIRTEGFGSDVVASLDGVAGRPLPPGSRPLLLNFSKIISW